MASGPFDRASKGFDFGSDDILCSYDDYTNEESSNGSHIDPSSKDFHISRMTKKMTFPPPAYNSPEYSLGQDVIAAVEKSMKTHTDNLMRFLEGISSRLSQLELYCYNVDKSIGVLRSELSSDHEEVDSKFSSLEKHLQEVHRSVQILRDKQELAETQKELAKLKLVQKRSSSTSHSLSNEERSSPSASDKKGTDYTSETFNQQLAIVLPHQVTFQQQPVAPPSQPPASNMTQTIQQPRCYMLPAPLFNLPAVSQHPQNHYVPSDPPYQNPQSTPSLSHVIQSLPVQQQSSRYQQPPQQQQQQWSQPQQLLQQVQPLQPPSMHSQMRPPSVNVYTPYLTNQATSPPPTDTLPNSMPMQMPYSGVPPPGTSHGDPMVYGYNGSGRTIPQQPPPQHIKGPFTAQQPGDVYETNGTPATRPPSSAYMIYGGESGKEHYPPQPSHFAQGGYPPPSASLGNTAPAPHNLTVQNPSQQQFIRSHPYSELIERFVSVGFRGDHVASVIQRMEDIGQPIGYNSVLDRLNVHSSVGPQRGWSG